MITFDEFLKENHEPYEIPDAVIKTAQAELKRITGLNHKINLKSNVYRSGIIQQEKFRVTPGNGLHDKTVKHYDIALSINAPADGMYQFSINLSWDYKEGGSNGATIARIWIDESGKVRTF